MHIQQRPVNQAVESQLVADGVNPLLARLYAARGVKAKSELAVSLAGMIPPEQLTNSSKMAHLLADAIAQQKSILVIGDYDADGATATAVSVKGLASMGATVDFLVPNRFEYGYGLTPEIVQLAATLQPDILLTVDNGIASIDGVAAANALGFQVLITDHHLPAETTPDAACIVNPNQHGCDFASKNLAGVGVMFYVLLALRAEMRTRGCFADKPEPNLTELLDLVALGTVADLVKLDANNRIFVEQGLRRIRAGACCAGITALLQISGKSPEKVTAQDLGFYVGPRLNAAGRLDDMRLGIACLLAKTEAEAMPKAQTLNDLNLERRNIEADMQDTAMIALEHVEVSGQFSLSIFSPDYHQGVIGILASRLKEKFHRPTIVFADAGDGLMKGSGRSIPNLHLRDALDLVTKQHPNLIVKFGGHAMAAGLTIKAADFEAFKSAFERVTQSLLTASDLQAVLETDGHLDATDMSLQTAWILGSSVWGQGFAQPVFSDTFKVINQRVLAGKHLKLIVEKDQKRFDAIYFNFADPISEEVNLAYALEVNEYKGLQTVQLQVKYLSQI